MEYSIWILVLAAFGAFFMAFNNGANDVANAFASAVGSKAITVKQALVIAATLNLVGAVLLGSHVASTLIESVIVADVVVEPGEYVVGMISALIAAGLFVLVSTLTGMPVSSTHAIVGSLAGVGITIGGFAAINWAYMGIIALSWVISPILAGILAWSSIIIIKKWIYRKRKKRRIIRRMRQRAPLFLSITCGFLAYSILERSPLKTYWSCSTQEMWAVIIATMILAYYGVRFSITQWSKTIERNVGGAESIFRKLQIGTSCYVAFAHGSNDVSNSISPVLAIYFVATTGIVPTGMDPLHIPIWILLLGGVGMALGIGFLGHKVMATLGNSITLMTNSKGFSVDFATATTVVAASIVGMPVSSTHAATGSIIGVGLDKGRRGLNFSVLRKIFMAWIITVPTAALITILIFSFLRWVIL